ncbi:hypothetical protein [Microvirga sp. VF16]|uniref:hypothetical protein n=1 Tax=Microvirga sp. VF16 TaxID=2807101 RepID=UPI00193DDA17|nr:hypothetical protein [Microvirga sp. VF16]QRM34796.1 hypothetical protein JO965_41785 [Microvirga sp. VF16]
MPYILKSYVAVMSGPDGSEQTVTVEVESLHGYTMLDDLDEILQSAQKRCAAKTLVHEDYKSDSDYLNDLDTRAVGYHLLSVHKPGPLRRFAYEGFVGENDEKLYTGPVQAVDGDEADFAARCGIALQAGSLAGQTLIKDSARFSEVLDHVTVVHCVENPVSLNELAEAVKSLVAAHTLGAPVSDLIDDLAVLTAFIPPDTPAPAVVA